MTPEELVEKVAQTIWARRRECALAEGVYLLSWESENDTLKNDVRDEARAALRVVREAMAEPDEAMQRAGRMREVLPGGGAITMWASNKWADMLAASALGRIEE